MISRRAFLKFSAICAGTLAACALPSESAALAASAFSTPFSPAHKPLPGEDPPTPPIVVRVTTKFINIYRQPDFKSERIGSLKRDVILPIPEEIISPYGPIHNPRWYHLVDGYVHSAYLQRVEMAHLNTPLPAVPASGQLGEITVPFSQSLRKTQIYGWMPLYRLYFGSVYWITSLEEGPDGEIWYGLTDDILHIKYSIPAAHMRPIPASEISPLSPDVDPREKRIEVSLQEQRLTAYEGKQVVLETAVSTGIPRTPQSPDELPTDTPDGYFHVEVKVPSRHMGDGNLTSDIEAYELPGVPWVSFFHAIGIAFHGTYWHNNFGRMMSHGCVNMTNEDAKWLYRWSLPIAEAENWNTMGHGTLVRVF